MIWYTSEQIKVQSNYDGSLRALWDAEYGAGADKGFYLQHLWRQSSME